MRASLAAVAGLWLLTVGCPEPPKTNQMGDLVSSLAHLHKWDPTMQAKGQFAYDAVMGYGPEIWPILAAHLTDDTPTAIYEQVADRNAKIADVAFLMLLQLTHRRWQDFAKEGVFVSTALPNPIFCIKWSRETQFKVQARMMEVLDEEKHRRENE